MKSDNFNLDMISTGSWLLREHIRVKKYLPEIIANRLFIYNE